MRQPERAKRISQGYFEYGARPVTRGVRRLPVRDGKEDQGQVETVIEDGRPHFLLVLARKP
jgi:hypothetical protein